MKGTPISSLSNPYERISYFPSVQPTERIGMYGGCCSFLTHARYTRSWSYDSILSVVARRKSFRSVSKAPGSLRTQSVVDRSGCALCPNNVLRRVPASSVPAVDLNHRIETIPLFVHLLCLSPLACAPVVDLTIPHSVLTHGPTVECWPVVSTRPLQKDWHCCHHRPLHLDRRLVL